MRRCPSAMRCRASSSPPAPATRRAGRTGAGPWPAAQRRRTWRLRSSLFVLGAFATRRRVAPRSRRSCLAYLASAARSPDCASQGGAPAHLPPGHAPAASPARNFIGWRSLYARGRHHAAQRIAHPDHARRQPAAARARSSTCCVRAQPRRGGRRGRAGARRSRRRRAHASRSSSPSASTSATTASSRARASSPTCAPHERLRRRRASGRSCATSRPSRASSSSSCRTSRAAW